MKNPAAFPQVLLLGNGINQAYGGGSWKDMLKAITQRDDLPEKLNSPMPLQAILASNDRLSAALHTQKFAQTWYGSLNNSDQKAMYNKLLDLPVTDILTTNYSYELEMAALGVTNIKEDQLKPMLMRSNRTHNCENKYRFYTYNRLPNEMRIWHIHGEARVANTMILGHYYYANNLAKMRAVLQGSSKRYAMRSKTKTSEFDCWLDSFILGDVYVLGFGFDLSEFDLWWLLNRKKLENANHGKVYFYEPSTVGFNEKQELLELMDVEIHDCGFSESYGRPCDYKAFYNAAIQDIRKNIEGK